MNNCKKGISIVPRDSMVIQLAQIAVKHHGLTSGGEVTGLKARHPCGGLCGVHRLERKSSGGHFRYLSFERRLDVVKTANYNFKMRGIKLFL